MTETTIRLALMGDTMLGRMVGDALRERPASALVAPEVVELARDADLRLLNLECCISERGERWSAPGKPFFFRAPPSAIDVLELLQIDCVTLANNHALDYGPTALCDTIAFLDRAGITSVGAGHLTRARTPGILEARGGRLAVLGVTDHPADYQAGDDRPGVAWADLRRGLPDWLGDAVTAAAREGAVLVTPHWGPNMVAAPLPYVRSAAHALCEAGATLVAGHSAHVVHGVEGRVLYDLGDFLDDYATDSELRNDLGLLFFVDLDPSGPRRIEAVPLELGYCHTGLAAGADAAWMRQRFRRACAALGSDVHEEAGRLVVSCA